MGGRRDDGYEARYRLDAPRTLRGVVAVLATVLVVGAWVATTLLAPRPSDVAKAEPTTPTRTAADEVPATGPSLPPSIERLAPIDDVRIPAVGGFGVFGEIGGLAWLDTRDGRLLPPAEHADPRWVFQEADGSTLCVCLRPQVGAPPHYELRSYDPSGETAGSVPVPDWPTTFVARTVTDVVVEPTNAFLSVAWAREIANERWQLGLDRISRGDGSLRTKDLAEVKTSHTLGSPVDVRLWLSPDARHARIRFAAIDGFQPGAPTDEGWWAWTVPIDGSIVGEAVPVREPSMPNGTQCFAQGWATPRDFVSACARDGGDVVTVRTRSLAGTVSEMELKAVAGPSWLMNQATGQLFLWTPIDDHIWVIGIPSLAVVERQFSTADLERATRDWPAQRGEPAVWLPRGWQPRPPWLDQPQLLGSRDGTVIYALGPRPARSVGDEPRANGVWVIDAGSLGVIDHWNPLGEYTTLALTPSGDTVIAAGGPTPEELMAFGSRGSTIAFHDAKGNGLSLILRGVTTWPTFLVSEPPPKPT